MVDMGNDGDVAQVHGGGVKLLRAPRGPHVGPVYSQPRVVSNAAVAMLNVIGWVALTPLPVPGIAKDRGGVD